MLKSRLATEEEVTSSGLVYRVYEPAGDGKKAGVILVHGRAGTVDSMWTFSKTFEEFKPVTISPQGALPDPIGGFSWWAVDPNHGRPKHERTFQSEVVPAVQELEKFVRKVTKLHDIDPKRVYAAGFSQGSALVTLLSLKVPELFQGVCVLGGFIPQSFFEEESFLDDDVISGKVKLPDYLIAHGTADDKIPIERAHQVRDYLSGLGAKTELVEDPVGHKIGSAGMKAMKEWFKERIG